MTDGLLFFWMGWLLWGIVTFFMKKGWLRTILACWILIIILFSNFYIMITSYHILLSFIILIVGVALLHATLSKQLYHLFVSFTMMIGYTALLLWDIGAELWMFIPTFILFPIMCSIFISFLTKGLYNRLITGILGIAVGELLYGFILSSYRIQVIIGDIDFLGNLFMTILFLLLLHILPKRNPKFSAILNNDHQ